MMNIMENISNKSEMTREEGNSYLQSLLNKNLRVTTTDSRMFWGSFKCTDPESNIVLQHTYEYRHPSPTSIAQKAASPSNDSNSNGTATVKVDMTSRYLGLVVVPGQHIVKIEVEEFASQMQSRRRLSPTITTTTTTTTTTEMII